MDTGTEIPTQPTETDVVDALEKLIQQAERETKWLFCTYQQLWFSPKELRDANARGQFRWGPINWRLRDPAERVIELAENVTKAKDELHKFMERI